MLLLSGSWNSTAGDRGRKRLLELDPVGLLKETRNHVRRSWGRPERSRPRTEIEAVAMARLPDGAVREGVEVAQMRK